MVVVFMVVVVVKGAVEAEVAVAGVRVPGWPTWASLALASDSPGHP